MLFHIILLIADLQHAIKCFPGHFLSHPPSQHQKELLLEWVLSFFPLSFSSVYADPCHDLNVPLGSHIENLSKIQCSVLSPSTVPRKWAGVMAPHTGLAASSVHRLYEGTRVGEIPQAWHGSRKRARHCRSNDG